MPQVDVKNNETETGKDFGENGDNPSNFFVGEAFNPDVIDQTAFIDCLSSYF